jgi:hypothetical protein
MEIYLDKRGARKIRLAAQEAIDEGDVESLREDILEAFSEEQVDEIERLLDSSDFYEFLTDVLDEWQGEDVEELFELLESQLAESGVDLKVDFKGGAAEEEEEEDEEAAAPSGVDDIDTDDPLLD